MPPTAFSPFEVLLLKSHDQRQTAALLLLSWVFVNKREPLDEDRRYLLSLAERDQLGEELSTLLQTATQSALDDIQLAAEVLLKHGAAMPATFLHQAVALATSDGTLSLRNHHVLRFLADLTGTSPAAFARLFRDITGRPLASPGDPSRHAYWQTATPRDEAPQASGPSRSSTTASSTDRIAWRARARQTAERHWRERRQRREQSREAAERERQRQREAEARASRQREAEARSRQEQARREQAKHERQRQEQAREEARRQRQEQEQARQNAGGPQPSYRMRLALLELELGADASRSEIRQAYRRLAQRHHPDRFHGQSEWRLRLASQRFQRIKNAYDLLMQHA